MTPLRLHDSFGKLLQPPPPEATLLFVQNQYGHLRSQSDPTLDLLGIGDPVAA